MLAALASGAVAVGSCGDDEDFPNNRRPPAVIRVTASISADEISVNRDRFGAGPVDLLITNLTGSSHEVALNSEESAARRVDQRTGPINPSDTASMKIDLRRGEYQLSVPAPGIESATIAVGPPRDSAQDQLLQP